VDAGVVVGLLWGTTATWWFILAALRTDISTVNPDLPKSANQHS
jgi:hypothetical protein